MASPASTSCSSVMRWRRVLALRDAVAREQRHVHEGREARTAVACGRLDRAPAQIIAEIAAGIARGARVDAGAAAARRSLAVCGPNIMASAPPAIDPLRARAWSASGHSVVTALRARVSIRTMRRARGEAEHQQRLRPVLRQQLRQFAIDGAGRSPERCGPISSTSSSAGRRSRNSRATSGCVGLKGAPGNGPKPVMRMRSFSLIVTSASPRSALPPAPA